MQDLSSSSQSTITADFVKTGNFEIDIFGVRYPASAHLRPPVLPKKISLEGLGDNESSKNMLL